jgi:hypothetical protein
MRRGSGYLPDEIIPSLSQSRKRVVSFSPLSAPASSPVSAFFDSGRRDDTDDVRRGHPVLLHPDDTPDELIEHPVLGESG